MGCSLTYRVCIGSVPTAASTCSTAATCSLYHCTASSVTSTVVRRFGLHRGNYMFHCHNLVHEDDDMLRALNVSVGGSQAKD
jgi:hypothetical protein